ncbi:MAG: sensor histidine kinase [Clostridiales bacterium]|nr:sensor histidine kinase [Clostridiales bacterium]
MEERPIKIVAIDFSEDEIENTFMKVKDSWYYLMSYYQELSIVVSNKDSESEDTYGSLCNHDASSTGNDYEFKFEFNDKLNAVLKVKESANEIATNDMDAFFKKTSEIRRKNPKSTLIPYGLVMITDNESHVNMLAEEMLFRTEINLKELESVFNKDNEPVSRNIKISNLMIDQFEVMAIKIPLVKNNEVVGSFIILSDETLIKKNESKLNYKSAVVKEIHHRVKNNLQTIASLLRLQMRRVKSKTVIRAFKESINRISSIALIHEELSKDGIEEVNIKSTIASIMDMILTDMVPSNKDIKGELQGPDVYIDANKASSISLCITELVQNSIEHGFSFRKKGFISIKLDLKDDVVTILVEDDGSGFNPQKSKNSLGLEIIEMITTETLKGTFSIKGHMYGTQTQITFKL